MAKSIKCRYDKNLKKYHIEYHQIKDVSDYRYKVIQRINEDNDLAVLIETHLGSVTKPDQMNYAKTLEGLFSKYCLTYHIQPIEIQNNKNFLGMLSGSKKTITHYAITFIIPAKGMTRDLFDDLLCEYDLQIGYKPLKPVEVFFEDLQKGYAKTVLDTTYYESNYYDSRIFNKFLATEDLTKISIN